MEDTKEIILVNTIDDASRQQKIQQMEDELEEIKTNLMDVADVSSTAIKEMVEVAKMSQHPRSYEALAKLIEAASKVNVSASDIVSKKHDLLVSPALKVQDQGVINNTYNDNRTVMMTTTDLLDEFKKE